MKSISETGHNKNAANFSSAYQIFFEMGGLFNPSNPNLALTAFQPIKEQLTEVTAFMNLKNPVYKNLVADREVAIAPLGKLLTQVLNAALSTPISEKDKENLGSSVKKIRGDTKAKKVDPEKAEGETISTSQMSYDNRVANFDAFISQLDSHEEYAPNEVELQIATLREYQVTLKNLNAAVNAAGFTLITARKNRNEALYYAPQNVIKIIKDVKPYMKSLGTKGAPYYKALVKLKFRDIQED
jgi:hypothetical protein